VTNAQTLSERAALHVYMTQSMYVPRDSSRAKLMRALSPMRNPVTFSLYLMSVESPRDANYTTAQAALSRLGVSPEAELLHAIERVRANELPGSLPQFILARIVPQSWRVIDAISRLDERFLRVRMDAAHSLAECSCTPDSVLLLLAQELPRHSDPALAAQLLWRSSSEKSLIPVLEILTELDSSRFGFSREARQALDLLAPERAARRDSMPTLATVTPSQVHRAAAPTQCRARDDWSEQIRRAVGGELVVGDTLCARAVAALDSAFELPLAYDSAYVLRMDDGYVLAFPPARPDAQVMLVRFDSEFVERSRRTLRIH
jgi:hypothetical protein